MTLASARGAKLSFDDHEDNLAAGQSGSQRPRAFYRDDLDAAPLNIALAPNTDEPIDRHITDANENPSATDAAAANVQVERRGMLGIFRKGPAEDLKADIVEELNSVYHTPNSTQAAIGTYGKAIKGNRLLGKLPRFEERGVVQQLDRVRRMETVHRQGHGSGKDFLSLFGSRRAWQVLNIGAEVSGGREQEVSFEILGVRLEQSDVIDALNSDRDALNYFDYLQKQGEPPCVVLENVWLTNYSETQKTNLGVGVQAETVIRSDSVNTRIQNERSASSAMAAPVVRCYQMYEAKLNQGRVVELVNVDP
jgi:hypothetical protein